MIERRTFDEPMNGAPPPGMPIDVSVDAAPPIENEDGSVEVPLGPADEQKPEPQFGDNLADHMAPEALAALALELGRLFDEDKLSRADWERMQAKGLEELGIKTEDRNDPWPGAFGARHPLLMEAVVRFQSGCIMEIFPSEAGPVKTKVMGEATPDVQDQADRVADYMNYQTTEVMSDYRLETEKLLFSLGFSGSAFRKIYPDPIFRQARADFIPAEDFIVPYGASSLTTAPRYTHVLRPTVNDVRRLQANGFYRDTDLGPPQLRVTANDVRDKKDQISKEVETVTQGERYELREMHADIDLGAFAEALSEEDGIAAPYIVTFDSFTNTILSIRRNWAEQDELKRKILHFTAYHFVPAFGFYSFGLLHLIGAMGKGATSLLRQLIDAGTLSNLPGGFKTADARLSKTAFPIAPGDWQQVDMVSGKLSEAFFPLPYKEPSAVLFSLLQYVVDEGRRLGSTADMDIGDMGAQTPVGTTLAILERALKIMSAVHARTHTSLHEEFKILARVIRDLLPEDAEYPYDVAGGSRTVKRADFDDRVDVLPVSNPNSSTRGEKMLQFQAILQMSQQAPPGTYDIGELHREFARFIGIHNVDAIIPSHQEAPLQDPIAENQAIVSSKPVKVYPNQNHAAHIQVHLDFIHDPKVAAQMAQNPQAQALLASAMAHVSEHIGWQYRVEMEQKLGIPLLAPGQALPEDVENSLSLAIANASQKLAADHKAEAAQQKAQETAADPLVQLQAQEIAVKASAVHQKEADSQLRSQTDLQKAHMREETERLRIQQQHEANQHAGQQQQFKNIADLKVEAKKIELDFERLRVEMVRVMGELKNASQQKDGANAD